MINMCRTLSIFKLSSLKGFSSLSSNSVKNIYFSDVDEGYLIYYSVYFHMDVFMYRVFMTLMRLRICRKHNITHI